MLSPDEQLDWSIQAMIRNVPSHSGQVSMSIAKMRWRRCIQLIGGRRLVGAYAPGRLRHGAFASFEVGGADPLKAGEVPPGPGHQGGEAGDEVEGFQNDLGRAVAKQLFVAVHDPAPAIDAEALGGNGWGHQGWKPVYRGGS